MARINLLPWREERRQQLKQQFFVMLGFVVFLAAAGVYFVYGYYTSEVENQKARNQFVKNKTAELETKISQIRDLQERRDQIVDSMKVIQELQGNRPVIVRSLSTIASTIPEGVYYTKIEKKGNTYKMFGVSETNNKISKLMRNLDDSDWFKDANLDKVTGEEPADEDAEKISVFELTVSQEVPAQEDGLEDEGAL